MSSRLGKVSD